MCAKPFSRLVLSVLFIFATCLNAAFAGTRADHFIPVEGFFPETGWAAEYNAAIRHHLLPRRLRDHCVGAVIQPSFRSEWSVILCESKDISTTLEVRSVDGQIWAATVEESPIPPVIVTAVEVDSRIATAIANAIRHALELARKPTGIGGGLDGTPYLVFYTGPPHVTGYAWSPEPNTLTGQSAAMLQLLRKYSKVSFIKKLVIELEIYDLSKSILRSN